jgi:cob(I)alamin adenosyltransferase
MYGRRVSKGDPRVDAYGTVDELNAALGLARASAGIEALQTPIATIQGHLVPIMGELATAPQDRKRYNLEGYTGFKTEFIAEIESHIHRIELEGVTFKGWATPGETPSGAALDLARTVCRRSERAVCRLLESEDHGISEVLVYLNRLSDLLWLMARRADAHPA